MATFEEILDSLLKDLEKNPQADVNKLAEQIAAKLRLKCDAGKVEEVNGIIDGIDSKYLELVKQKEETGISTQSWLRKSILKTAAEHNMSEEEQTTFLESLAEHFEQNIDDNLEKLN